MLCDVKNSLHEREEECVLRWHGHVVKIHVTKVVVKKE